MNLFSRIAGMFSGSARESRGGSADVARTPGHWQALMNDWGGESGKLDDPYNNSPWVQRAIKHVSGPISGVSLKFTVPTATGDVELVDPALEAFWKRPAKGLAQNSRLSRVDTMEATVGWLLLEGEFFWILDDTWLTRAAAKSPLMIARPDRLRPVMERGELVGWEFRDADKVSHLLIPEQVVSSRFWNPNSERGSAPMQSARMAAEADYAASRFWKSLAESNGDLGETVIAPNGISPEQEAQLKLTLRRKRAAAKKGRYEPLFIVGDVKTEAPNIQSPDASAVTQRLQNRHEIFIAFGVPPSFAEVTASYSIGSASDRFRLLEDTCIPIAAKIAEAVEMVSELLIGRAVSAEFDFKEHSTMQQVRSERLEAGRKMHERGIPWSVISDHLDLDLPEFPGWDKAWLPFNLQEVEKTQDLKTQDAREEEEVEEPLPGVKVFAELEELMKGCAEHGKPAVTRGPANTRWEKLMKGRAPYVKRLRVVVDKALFEARKETLGHIAKAAAEEKVLRSGAFDFIFDLANFLQLLIEPVFRLDYAAYEAAGVELISDEIGGEAGPFIAADPRGLEWLQKRKNYIKEAGTEMWVETRDSLEEGISAGESYDKLAKRVREKFNDMSKERSMRIAVTETSIAMESGRHEAMVQAGAEWKEWLTSEDDRVRLSHYAVNGKRIPMDEPFMVGGAAMMYPCDPNGPPSEIINCRCVHGPVDGPDADPADMEGNNPDGGIPY